MFEIICRVGPDKGGRWEIIDDDPIVPHAHGKALYDLAPGDEEGEMKERACV